jgi:hypothetical protein
MPFEDGQDVNGPVQHPVDDAIGAKDDFSDIFTFDFGHVAAGQRRGCRGTSTLAQPLDPLSRRVGMIAGDVAVDVDEISARAERPVEPTIGVRLLRAERACRRG